ncbi:MAG TPA: metal-sensing transcriptional repressor [Desulfosporosinus sp.]|nr:metal-sensing transcriptional repressor [Desulfosporosinus sp.]
MLVRLVIAKGRVTLNQISPAQSALEGAARLLLAKHMKSCVKKNLQSGEEESLDEVLKTIFQTIR